MVRAPKCLIARPDEHPVPPFVASGFGISDADETEDQQCAMGLTLEAEPVP